jgi:hypothetical protein
LVVAADLLGALGVEAGFVAGAVDRAEDVPPVLGLPGREDYGGDGREGDVGAKTPIAAATPRTTAVRFIVAPSSCGS